MIVNHFVMLYCSRVLQHLSLHFDTLISIRTSWENPVVVGLGDGSYPTNGEGINQSRLVL